MSNSTADVLQHHLEAFGNGDLAAILSDYSDDSILVTPETTLRGPAEMGPFFEGLFADFATPGTSFAMKTQTVEGEIAYIVWTAETGDNVYELGTDTFLVRDGKIAVQTYAAKIRRKS